MDSRVDEMTTAYLSIRRFEDSSKRSFSKWMIPVHLVSRLECRLRGGIFNQSHSLAPGKNGAAAPFIALRHVKRNLNCGCVSCWATKIHDKAAPAATEDGADRFKIDKRRPFHILKDARVVK